jgi:AcrR family transcriptional regulator
MPDQPSRPRPRPGRAWVGLDPSADDEPRRQPLTRPRVVRAALRLVDEKGLDALTMRALAAELEVSAMALYNHVHDKDELVDLMVDLMLGEVDCNPGPGATDWATQLRNLVCSYHQALSAHPQLARVYSSRVCLGPHGLTIIERVLQLLLQAGFPPATAADAFFALYTYTVGFHQMGEVDALEFSALPAEQIPTIVALAPHLRGTRRRGGFEYGLDTLLAGLNTTHTHTDTAPAR